MKQNLLIMILIALMSCNVTFIFSDSTDWITNASEILNALANLTEQLSNDAAVFDSITQEISGLVEIITNQDVSEQDLINKLSIQFTELVQAYLNLLQQEQAVQLQNALALQQLKITLATVQATLQAQIDQLSLENDADETLLQQLTDQYNTAVADNQQEAADLLSVLRSVCEAYMIMVQEKQLSVDGLYDILTALENHIANATAGFDQLNMIINQ